MKKLLGTILNGILHLMWGLILDMCRFNVHILGERSDCCCDDVLDIVSKGVKLGPKLYETHKQ